MSFLKNLFVTANKKDSAENKKRLVDLVNKKNKSSYGTLYDIYQDLGEFVDYYPILDNHLINMAYGYARREIVDFMYLQGQITIDDFNYNRRLFNAIQQRISKSLNQDTYEKTIEFQNEAADQAFELLLSYSDKYDKNLLKKVGMILQSNNTELINIVQDTFKSFHNQSKPNEAHFMIIELLNNFMNK